MTKLTEILRCLWGRARAAWGVLLTKMNALGALLLLYLAQHPNAPADLFALFPEAIRPIAKVLIPALWWWAVQHATKRAVQHGK